MEHLLATGDLTPLRTGGAEEAGSAAGGRGEGAPWPTGDVCALCEGEVVLTEDATALCLECACGPVVVLT